MLCRHLPLPPAAAAAATYCCTYCCHLLLPPALPKTDLASGHFSASDRYKYLRELAFEYAFMLDQLGLGKVASASAPAKVAPDSKL